MLFRLLRNVLGCERYSSPVCLNDDEWVSLYYIAQRQNTTSMIYKVISSEETNIGFDTKMNWATQALHVQELNRKHILVLERLKDALAVYGIRIMVLKGIGLASLYPDPLLRECGDIDIWCFGEYERANDIIDGLGASGRHADTKHCSFRLEGINIENHRRFNRDFNKANIVVGTDLDTLIEVAPVPLPTTEGVVMPNPTANAIFLMIHMLNHLAWSGIKVRHLVDWTVFVNSYFDQVDWEHVIRLWRDAGLTRSVSLVYSICVDMLGCRKNEGIPYVFEDDKDYWYILNDILHPVPSPSSTKSRIRNFYLRYRRHKVRCRRHGIVYDEPYPNTLHKILIDKYIRRKHDSE